MLPQSGLARYVAIVWSLGLVGQAFLISGGIAFVALAITILRSAAKRRINAPVFLAQLRKLVDADNVDRAIKLASIVPGLAVCSLALTGIEAGLYRDAPADAEGTDEPSVAGGG